MAHYIHNILFAFDVLICFCSLLKKNETTIIGTDKKILDENSMEPILTNEDDFDDNYN